MNTHKTQSCKRSSVMLSAHVLNECLGVKLLLGLFLLGSAIAPCLLELQRETSEKHHELTFPVSLMSQISRLPTVVTSLQPSLLRVTLERTPSMVGSITERLTQQTNRRASGSGSSIVNSLVMNALLMGHTLRGSY
jgi:hypothetical protein